MFVGFALVSSVVLASPPATNMTAPAQETAQPQLVRTRTPIRRGLGWFILGSSWGVVMLGKRITAVSACNSMSCNDRVRTIEYPGYAIMAGSFAFGGWQRGRYEAYRDVVEGRAMPRLKPRLVTGIVLTAVGGAAVALDIGFMFACRTEEAGPYHRTRQIAFGQTEHLCKSDYGDMLLDFGAASTSAGAALWTHSTAYKRDREVYERGRLVVVPRAGAGFYGLSATGRF